MSRLAGWIHDHPTRFLLIWLFVRTISWTLAMSFGHANAQIDMIEWGSWSGVLTWGYPKHPPLPGWLAGLFLRMDPGQVWPMYFAGYLLSSACLYIAWRLALEFMSPIRATFAALALDGLTYLTIDAADFSNNIVMDFFWALSALTIFKALQSQKLHWWVAVGIAVGGALLTKYVIGLLLVPLAIYALLDRSSRASFKTMGPYVAILIAGLMITPHLIWLHENQYITLHYIRERSDQGRGFIGMLTKPWIFLGSQITLLLGVGFVTFPMLALQKSSITKRQAWFLHSTVFGPVSILVAMSFLTGTHIRMIWASPLWTFSGVWLLMMLPSDTTVVDVRRSLYRWLFVIIGMPLYAVSWCQLIEPIMLKRDQGRTIFPGREMTAEINRLWSERFREPFPIVAGEPWRAGIVCVYSPHRPQLYSSGKMGAMIMEPQHSPWTSDEDFLQRGGVIVWDDQNPNDFTDYKAIVRERFPTAEILPTLVLPYQRGSQSSTHIGVAFLAPGK